MTEMTQDEETRWRLGTLYLVTAIGIGVCAYFIHLLLFPLVGAATLATVTLTPQKWLLRRCGPSVCALIVTLTMGAAILLPGYVVTRALVDEVVSEARFAASGEGSVALQKFTAKHPKIGGVVQQGLDQLDPDQSGRQVAGKVAGWVGRGLQNAASGVTQVALLLFFLFFFVRDREAAKGALTALIPLPDRKSERLVSKLSDVVYAVFVGRLLVAFVQGTLAGLAYWMLGVPAALLWAALTAICCIVPALGAFFVWVPVALYLGLDVSWTKALILALWGGVVISNLDNVLYPVLVGQRTDMHTVVIFVSILGGLELFGISGVVLGPVIVAATILLLKEWRAQGEEVHVAG